jgi:hypothetical protein
MLYLAIFCIAVFILFEYLDTIYKESNYYKEDVVNVSFEANDSLDYKESDNKLKIKEL